MRREPSDTSADGSRLAFSELDLYATVKRIMGGDITASEDELLMMAAYLIGMLEDDH